MKCFGVMGGPGVVNSKSPAMHNAAFAQAGIEACYATFPVREGGVRAALEGVRALCIAGINVTVPHKETVARLMDRLEGEASALGAVNTVVNQDGLLVGHNTDVGGFNAALANTGFRPKGKSALLLGCGGAARAVAHALAQAGGGALWVAGRDQKKAARFCADLGGEPISLQDAAGVAEGAELLVNATSVSGPDEGPDLAQLAPALAVGGKLELVMDLNYGRARNIWRDLAQARGANFRDGLGMLAQQACLSFKLWTGLELGVEVFLQALGEDGDR